MDEERYKMGTTLPEIKIKGWIALIKELGYAGATKFILLYEQGEGEYTEQRRELFKGKSVKVIVDEMKEKRE